MQPRRGRELALSRDALGPELREPTTHDDETVYTFRGARRDDRDDLLGADRHDREVDRSGRVADVRIPDEAFHRFRPRVDRIDRSAKTDAQQASDDPVTDRSAARAGPEHRDGRGAQQSLDRACFGHVLTRFDALGRLRREIEAHGQMRDAVLPRMGRHESRVGEHLEHAPVLRQRVRYKPFDAFDARPGGEMLEEQRSHPTALPPVRDDERNLRVAGRPQPVVPGHADDVVADGRDQRLAVVVVDRGEADDLLVREVRVRSKEPQSLRLGRQAFVESLEPLGIRRLDRAQSDDAPVGEQRVLHGLRTTTAAHPAGRRERSVP